MNHKTLTIIFGMILLVGIITTSLVSAEEYAGIINNITGIDISDFTAGSTTTATFSFNYQDYYGDTEYPHILRINISSLDEDYPVWKGDFELSGFVRKYTFFGLFYTDVNLKCSEESPLIIDHPLGLNTLNVPDGTFYCYNTTSEAVDQLDKYDKVFLNIKSHPALWPGQYSLSVTINYLEDTKAPFVNILNKNAFETRYYRELNDIEVQANINEINLDSYWGTIFAGGNITVPFSHKIGDTYYFTKILPIDIQEGNYELKIFAQDTSGNIGNDSTTLKIDRTGPNIIAIQPNGSIYEEIIPVELIVTDAKSGVNNQSVYYRLREMNETSICPEAGIGTWDCYNSGWVKINLNPSTETYKTEINTTVIKLESGEYWFEAKAEDLLGNIGILE
jgi:hypothetical protein